MRLTVRFTFVASWVLASALELGGCERWQGESVGEKNTSAAVSVSATPSPEGVFDETDRKAIVDTLTQQAQAWSRGDLDAFMQAYEQSEALVFTAGGQVRRGFSATAENYARRYRDGEGARMGTLAFEILDVRGLGGDAAVVLGEFELTDTPQAGSGVFTLVLVRNDGRWQIVHDHTSGEATSEREDEGRSTSDER